MKHTANHQLGISNGWGGSWGESGESVSVWCGRCKDSFTPDDEWVARYFDAKRTRADRDHEQSITAIEDERGSMLARLARIAGVVALGVAILASTTAGFASCGSDNGPNGDRTPQPGYTTHVTPRPSSTPTVNPTHQAAPRGDAPAGALCHDSTVVTTAAQCAGHGGLAEP